MGNKPSLPVKGTASGSPARRDPMWTLVPAEGGIHVFRVTPLMGFPARATRRVVGSVLGVASGLWALQDVTHPSASTWLLSAFSGLALWMAFSKDPVEHWELAAGAAVRVRAGKDGEVREEFNGVQKVLFRAAQRPEDSMTPELGLVGSDGAFVVLHPDTPFASDLWSAGVAVAAVMGVPFEATPEAEKLVGVDA